MKKMNGNARPLANLRTAIDTVPDGRARAIMLWMARKIGPEGLRDLDNGIAKGTILVPQFAKPHAIGADTSLEEKLRAPIEALEWTVRTANCLKEARIRTIGDLVRKTEPDMLRFRNFGRKALIETTENLKDIGLHFGMQLPPETV
jgi:DNA-directed RNA polymerase alpha subunit